MQLPGEAVVGVRLDGTALATDADAGLETIFRSQYKRVARIIARVIRDPGRAEELAVDVFVKWSRRPIANGPQAEAWLCRTAVRVGLDELRRQTRRNRYESLAALISGERSSTPEDIRASGEEQDRVRRTLAAMPSRQAALLVLRSDDFSYAELASTLKLNAKSVGTLLARAQKAFRKEYVKRYGEP